ncbi:MAG: fused MFS/spermidine synthase [Burkholderiales bacterium]
MPGLEISQEAGVRYLQFDKDWVQGAMRLSDPTALELAYSREMMVALLLHEQRSWPKSVLQVGLGAGSISRFLHRYCPKARLVVVEIDPRVLITAWQSFELPKESSRFRVELDDGYRYMGETRDRFDWIIIDGFKAGARQSRLDSLSFYRSCRKRLANEGMMAVNLIGKRQEVKAYIERIRRAFDHQVVALDRCEENTVVLAGALPRLDVKELRKRALKLRASAGLNLTRTIFKLVRAQKL